MMSIKVTMFIRHNDKKGQKPKRDWTGYINLEVISVWWIWSHGFKWSYPERKNKKASLGRQTFKGLDEWRETQRKLK